MKLKLNKPICFFDLETTGVDTMKDRIVEIAVIKLFPNGDKETKKYLINPEMPIPKEASDVHGITDGMVKDCPPFSKYAKNLNEYIGDSDLGGYNSNSFDIPLLVEEFLRCGIVFDLKRRNYVDVLNIEKQVSSRKLGDVYQRYTGKVLDGAHDALIDIDATIEILENQIEKHGLDFSIEALDEFSQGENKRIDMAGKLIYVEDKICWAFGKNFKKPILDDMGYVFWFLKQEVPNETRIIINKILENK